jgi:hypothetical protein
VTDLEIVNAALGKLGCPKITLIDSNGDSAESVLAGEEYAQIRDALLQSRQWTFAKDRVELVEASVTPVFGFAHKYIIPNDILTVIRVYDGSATTLADWWSNTDTSALQDAIVESGHVLTDSSAPVFAEVLKKVTENSFPPLFVRALVANLAAEWAIPLTENRAVADSWEVKFEKRLLAAAIADGKQGVSEVVVPMKLPGRRR